MAPCVFSGVDKCAAEMLGDALGAMAKSFADAAGWAVKNMMTVWMKTPGPAVGDGSTAEWLQGRMTGLILVVTFVSILWAAWRMATSGSFEHLAELGWSLFRLIVVSGSVSAVAMIAVKVGDDLAAWMLADVQPEFGVAFLLTPGAMSPPIVMLLALVVMLAQLVQAVLMLVKNAMIVLLVGFLPLTAAATNTSVGRAGALKAFTWLGAFLLYKPVAATIYAVSFKLTEKQQGLAAGLSGITLMLLAIFALPALMRFLVPITASAAGGNAGAVAGATVGAAVASGAVLVAGSMSGGAGFAAAPAAMRAAPTGAALGSAPSATGASTTTSPDRQDD